MADPALYSDAQKAADVQRTYQKAQQELQTLYEQWEAAEAAPDQPPAEEPPAPAPTQPKGRKKKRKKAASEEEDGPLEGQILLDEVIRQLE